MDDSGDNIRHGHLVLISRYEVLVMDEFRKYEGHIEHCDNQFTYSMVEFAKTKDEFWKDNAEFWSHAKSEWIKLGRLKGCYIIG